MLDLVSLIEQQSGIRLTRRANNRTNGDEYWEMCPFCGTGDDRFHVWPNKEYSGRARPYFWCRVCERRGDPIAFLMEYSNFSYVEACNELCIDPAFPDWTGNMTQQCDSGGPPPELWQTTGKDFIERAARYLWLPVPAAQEMLAYLRGRGFTDETIKQARLGYCPLQKDGRWYTDTFEHWGLNADNLTEQQFAKGCVRIPPGIVIPWFEADRLWKIAVKRPGEDPDYGQVLGSAEGMYNIDAVQSSKPLMMVEGEFDCLSVLQEASDVIAVVATGSAKRGRNPRWMGELGLASAVLQSFDDDQGGDEGASYWLESLSRTIRWVPFPANDPNELLQRQGEPGVPSIREWVEYGLDAAWVEFEQNVKGAPVTLAREPEPTLDIPTFIGTDAQWQRHLVKSAHAEGEAKFHQALLANRERLLTL